MKTVRFDYFGLFTGYRCSEPDPAAGEYVPADEARAEVARLERRNAALLAVLADVERFMRGWAFSGHEKPPSAWETLCRVRDAIALADTGGPKP